MRNLFVVFSTISPVFFKRSRQVRMERRLIPVASFSELRLVTSCPRRTTIPCHLRSFQLASRSRCNHSATISGLSCHSHSRNLSCSFTHIVVEYREPVDVAAESYPLLGYELVDCHLHVLVDRLGQLGIRHAVGVVQDPRGKDALYHVVNIISCHSAKILVVFQFLVQHKGGILSPRATECNSPGRRRSP